MSLRDVALQPAAIHFLPGSYALRLATGLEKPQIGGVSLARALGKVGQGFQERVDPEGLGGVHSATQDLRMKLSASPMFANNSTPMPS